MASKRVHCCGCLAGRGKLKKRGHNPQLHPIRHNRWVCSDCLEVIGLIMLDALEGIKYESSWRKRMASKRVRCCGCLAGRGKLKKRGHNPQLHPIRHNRWVCSDCLEVIGLITLDALEGIKYESSWIDRLNRLIRSL